MGTPLSFQASRSPPSPTGTLPQVTGTHLEQGPFCAPGMAKKGVGTAGGEGNEDESKVTTCPGDGDTPGGYRALSPFIEPMAEDMGAPSWVLQGGACYRVVGVCVT